MRDLREDQPERPGSREIPYGESSSTPDSPGISTKSKLTDAETDAPNIDPDTQLNTARAALPKLPLEVRQSIVAMILDAAKR